MNRWDTFFLTKYPGDMYFPTIAGSNRFKEIVNGEYPVYCRVLGFTASND